MFISDFYRRRPRSSFQVQRELVLISIHTGSWNRKQVYKWSRQVSETRRQSTIQHLKKSFTYFFLSINSTLRLSIIKLFRLFPFAKNCAETSNFWFFNLKIQWSWKQHQCIHIDCLLLLPSFVVSLKALKPQKANAKFSCRVITNATHTDANPTLRLCAVSCTSWGLVGFEILQMRLFFRWLLRSTQ